MDFELFFSEQLADLSRGYGLKTEKWGSREYALIGHDFILMFVGELTGSMELAYIRRDLQGNLKMWNVDWYIGTAVNDQDRSGLIPKKTILDGWKNDVIIVAHLLKRCFGDLLSGGDQWMERYLKSEYAFLPHNLTGAYREQAEKYI